MLFMSPANVTKADLTDKLVSVLRTPRLVLFAGAGISARVGLPNWREYLEQLAIVCETHSDHTSALLIREKVNAADYLGAASIYKLSHHIPKGVLYAEMAKPFERVFKPEQLTPLDPLMECNFSAIVTTNYDRVLHNAYSKSTQTSPLHLQLDDQTIRNAAPRTEFFIARIHGRCEKPDTIVLDQYDYERLSSNDCYLDFLLDLLTHRQCLFLGFSFVDPAISQILNIFRDKRGPNYPALHYALLPATSQKDLGKLLRSVNIAELYYDDTDSHKALWQTIGAARDKLKLAPAEPTPTKHVYRFETAPFSRFFAFTYAQLRSQTVQNPVLETVQEGLILSLMGDAAGKPVDEAFLIQGVRNTLNLGVDQAERVVLAACRRLLQAGEIIQAVKGLCRKSTVSDTIVKEHLRELAEHTADRLRVRESKSSSQITIKELEKVLEKVFLVRAWDLAAHYAGAGTGYAADLPAVISSLVDEVRGAFANPRGVKDAIFDLLVAPTDSEATLLAELGRCALAVQLILSSPRQTLFQQYALPEIIYLDSNILLPALVDGHPLRPIYMDAIKRLSLAARSSGGSCELCVVFPFLNEVISHRRIGQQLVKDLNLDDPNALWHHIAYYGASNTNVFVGAFANHVGRGVKKIKFAEFLKRAAPYETETELAFFIEKRGIRCLRLDPALKHSPEKAALLAHLIQGYEETKRRSLEHKETVLKEHEADQILLLERDIRQRRRPLFVTADMQLQRIVRELRAFSHISSAVVSQFGFIGLVDIMVGLTADKRSLARLMWAVPRTEAQHQVRDYFIARVLKEYDAALATAMHRVIDNIVDETVQAAKIEGVSLSGGEHVEDIARTAKLLDRYEEQFFKLMREEIEKQAT